MSSSSSMSDVDRFSTLPDEVGHKILEFVSSRDISRLSAVSRRCLHLCLSAPSFDVDDSCVRRNAMRCAFLMNYVDRVLFRRCRLSPDIPVFRVNWDELRDWHQEYRFLSWLHAALLSNVKELSLRVANLRHASKLTMPSSLVSCSSLEILSLRFCRGGVGGIATFKIPSTDVVGGLSSSLKSLTLHYVRIDRSVLEWISRCCKCLRTLDLDSTHGTDEITVTSSSLKDLSIRYPYTYVHLEVHAENLETLTLFSHLPFDPDEEFKLVTPNLRYLHQAKLVYVTDDYVDVLEHRHSTVSDKFYYPRMSLILHDLSSKIVILRMFGDTIQEMYEQGSLPIEMPNLLKLNLDMNRAFSSRVDFVSLMATVLNGTPNLSELYMGFTAIPDDCDKEMVRGGGLSKPKSFPLIPKLQLLQYAFPYGAQKSKLELIDLVIDSTKRINILCPTPLPWDVYSQITGYEKTVDVNVIHWNPGWI